MITPRLVHLVIFATLLTADAKAANPIRGHLLYQNFCHHCHMTEIHYRVNSDVTSWDKLLYMVVTWQAEMRLGWQKEEIADVASYLDWAYYRFPGGVQ